MVIGSYIYIYCRRCYKCVKRKKNVDVWECINVFNRPLKCSVGGRNRVFLNVVPPPLPNILYDALVLVSYVCA